jgi:hypothetical protein
MTVSTSRGALLLELVIALGVTIAVGVTLLSMLGQSQRSLVRSVELSRAADLASSALAKLDAGLATVDDLDGADDTFDIERREEIALAIGDVVGDDATWRLSIVTERSGVSGLSVVTVTAQHTRDESVSFTLRRLVRLVEPSADRALRESELQGLIDDAAGGSRFGSGQSRGAGGGR